jgi:glycosyltransferase involved in cell wall biosynthesis
MKPIYLTAPINDLSYGIVSRNILDELVKKRTVLLSVLGRQEILNKNIHESIRNFQEVKVDNITSSVKIYHQFDLAHHIGKGNHIGFPFFELDEFSDLEKKHLSLQDVILVASNWAKEIVESQIETKCEVVPLGVDTDIFYPNPQHTNSCVFLNIGKMEYRKGHDIILKACKRVFKGKNDCMLWMVSNNPFVDCSSFEKEYRQTLGSNVAFLPKVSNQNEIAAIINRSNYGIYPFRSEGWGLPIMESLACGLPVAATNYSAPTEYLTEDNSYMINHRDMEPAFDGTFFDGSIGRWAKLDEKYEDDLVDIMEHMYSEWKNGDHIVNLKGIETSLMYTWEKTVEGILDCD